MIINAISLRSTLATLIVSVSLAGCGAIPSQSSTPEASAASPEDNDSRSAPRITATPLDGQTFYQLLMAEIATNRREYGTAAELYSRLAQHHDDTEIAQRAVALNQVVGNYERMQEHAQHWANLSPSSSEAWQALSIASLASADFDSTEAAMAQWLKRTPNADLAAVLASAQQLDSKQKQQLLAMLKQLNNRFPRNSSLPHGISQLLIERESFEAALPFIRQARSLEDTPSRGLLEYRVLLELERIDAARSALENLAEKYPQNTDVAKAYASFAYADGQGGKPGVLQSLFNRFPNEPIIVRAFARESFDNEDYDTAEALFDRLLTTQFDDEAHFFLGLINEENARNDLAVDHYLSISEPPFLVSALAELSELWHKDRMTDLRQQLQQARQTHPEQSPVLWQIEANAYRSRGDLEQAYRRLEQGLSEYPDNVDLLYDQALLAANLGRHQVAEANLQAVLEQDPDNASALNALGYTWADQDKNLEKAAEYINRALELRPDDPAIMDSKGWLEYRLGNYQAAEKWLRKAIAAFDNDEVAAHLAELLWVTDRKQEAREWLNHALELNPDSPTAQSVIEQYEVEL